MDEVEELSLFFTVARDGAVGCGVADWKKMCRVKGLSCGLSEVSV